MDALVKIDVMFGHSKLEQRYRLLEDEIVCESRVRHFDRELILTSESSWEEISRIGFDKPTGLFAWWEKRQSRKELKRLYEMMRGRFN